MPRNACLDAASRTFTAAICMVARFMVARDQLPPRGMKAHRD